MTLGAAFAPLLHGWGGWFTATFEDSALRENPIFADIYKSIARSPFTRFFDRGVLIAALLLLWPAFRLLRSDGDGAGMGMGLEKNPAKFTHLGFGFCLAAGGLLALGHFLTARGMFFFEQERPGLAGIWVAPLVAAIAVSSLEEFLFRGGMLGLLQRSMGVIGSMLLVSALFAIVHFLEAPDGFAIEPDEVEWSSGFVLLGKMLGHLGDTKVVVAELLLLFVVGLALASVRFRSRSLWMPMGLHAGWVFGVQLYSAATEPTKRLERGEYLPWMGDDLKIGLLPLAVVGVTWALAVVFLRRSSRLVEN